MMPTTRDRRRAAPRHIDIVTAFVPRWGYLLADYYLDPAFPQCFACGYFQHRWLSCAPWDEAENGPTPDKVLNDRWKATRLERAHILGHQFGGPNSPDNYALLCKRCHIEAPDVANAEHVVRWIAHREWWPVAVFKELQGLAPDDLGERWAAVGGPKIAASDLAEVADRFGVHFDACFGPVLSLSTLAAVVVDALESAVARQVPGQLALPMMV